MGTTDAMLSHPAWRQPLLSDLLVKGRSFGEQLVRASVNIALHGTLNGEDCAAEDGFLFRFPWFYVEAAPVLLEDLHATLNTPPEEYLSLLGPRLIEAATATTANDPQTRLQACLQSLPRDTLSPLCTGRIGPPLPDGGLAAGMVSQAVLPPWARMGPAAAPVDCLLACLRWLSALGPRLEVVAAQAEVLALAWCAFPDPTVLYGEDRAQAYLQPVRGVWRSTLVTSSGSLAQVVVARQTVETWEHTKTLAEELTQADHLREADGLGVVAAMKRLPWPTQAIVEQALIVTSRSIKPRDDAFRAEVKAKLRAVQQALQDKKTRRERTRQQRDKESYPITWDASWGPRTVRLLTKLRKAGRKGRKQEWLKKNLHEDPSRIIADMVKSKNRLKANLGHKIRRLRSRDQNGEISYRLFRE